jgi:hypothetical protein
MTTTQRFSFNDNGYIIDRLNPAATPVYCHEGHQKDDMHLREQVLWIRLADLVEDLITNINPIEKLSDGREYQRWCAERHSISWALYNAITASHLNTLDVALSIQHVGGGELKREKVGLQDFTSLSLFVDDVERLLRNLYGEFDNQAVKRVRTRYFGSSRSSRSICAKTSGKSIGTHGASIICVELAYPRDMALPEASIAKGFALPMTLRFAPEPYELIQRDSASTLSGL